MALSLEQPKSMALYYYDSCPFCVKTRKIINKTSLNIELRNIQKNNKHRIELKQGGNKTQVPCLRIEEANGDTKWLYESGYIINFLIKQKS